MTEASESPRPVSPLGEAPASEPETAAPSESLIAAGAVAARDEHEVVHWGRVAAMVGVILLGAVGLAGLLVATKKTPPRSDAKPALKGVRVFLAQVRDVQAEVVGLGRVRPRRRVVISAQVGGLAQKVHPDLRDGAYLEAGTVAVQIDRADYDAELRRASALADSARADVERLRANVGPITSRIALARELLDLEVAHLARTKDMFEKDVRTDRDVDSARLSVLRNTDALLSLETTLALLAPQLAAAQARVAEAEAAQSTASLKRARTTIRLPFRGQVAKVGVEEHQLLSPGQALFELWQVDVVEVPVALSLSDATLLAEDLDMRPKSKSDESIRVQVERETGGKRETWDAGALRFEPVDGATQTVKAVVEIQNPTDRAPLFPDVFCRVTLTNMQAERGLAIPISALQERDRVYVVRDGKLAILAPTFGKRLGRWVFVEDGLEEGEQIIVSPLERVVEGVELAIVGTVEESE